MDPTECLRRILGLSQQLADGGGRTINRTAELGVELAEKVLELDEWLAKGGFVPNQWMPRPPIAPFPQTGE